MWTYTPAASVEADPIVTFYEGGHDSQGRTLEEILRWPNAEIERVHDYIQWLFPTRARSQFNARAPLVTDATVLAFATRPVLRQRLARASLRMWSFYDTPTPTWTSLGNHNQRRITRIITSLRELGLIEEARSFHSVMKKIYRVHSSDERPTLFWDEALQG